MARPLRIQYHGAWYHVMNRGRRGERIFHDQRDHLAFIDLLKRTAEMFRAGVVAYCLMSNHYHLLLHTPEGNLTRCMRHVGGVYTQRFNRRYGHDGPLFRGRYKAILIEEEEYLLGLVHYIHHNPVKAGVADQLNDYPWSSHLGYLSDAAEWDWLYKKPVLSRFSGDPISARKAYRQYMSQNSCENIEHVFSLKKLPAALGSKEFLQDIRGKYFPEKKHPEVPESKFLAPSRQAILDAVCRAYAVTREEILISKRGVTNEARNMAVYLLRFLRGESLSDIAEMFGIKTYSTVSSILGRIGRKLVQDKALQKRLAALENGVRKSQELI